MDLVFDVYRTPPIKRETRESRGSGIRVSVRSEIPLVKSTQGSNAFLKIKQLFELSADMLIEETNELPTIIVATEGDMVLSNNKVSVSEIHLCFQEEADTRILLHMNHVARSGLKRITISTVHTDIVVISLYIFFDLNVDEYGVSTRKKWIPVHSYANEFGEENCRLGGCICVCTYVLLLVYEYAHINIQRHSFRTVIHNMIK